MVIIFGPAGSGKSLQGQFLAARNGWRWLSVGQVLRDTKDRKIHRTQRKGTLVDNRVVIPIMKRAIDKSLHDVDNIVLDGYPRDFSQAEWLLNHNYPIDLAISLIVPKKELFKRLHIRGRADDTSPDVITERISIFEREFSPIRQLLLDHKVKVIDIDGDGTVGEVHDRIAKEVAKCKLA